ncbi:MAG: UTP--glucose-1-phosphate uridylyltransferase [Candidatus Thiodiazotropha sp. (ex. Lucinisca nassula)]|nr:UTP--glucose-1-phosphate uridylyltransferase [Candidatus Thiodiazotropha taylori]MBW9259667.1 UTP--glucose-1-phosphate uridylyltransferase [Candidatus Thiodiazotropha sp. (ex. Lucinisca nassula)]MBW9263825.1 UTP--glucose-1-phosphate uridylyltransferase [Candidatus Thiodiazotropha sp. (ex. Lucinisca nassula)]MBW9268827.1 UTP--glucose-1-phosphate uridylyltransferase [Candidatus Thiodiazotropha sp. (ex. Lucinisca nassula)]
MPDTPPDRQIDSTLALVLLIILLFSTPVMMWWTSPGSHWYLPYLLWLAVIFFIAWVNRRRHEP